MDLHQGNETLEAENDIFLTYLIQEVDHKKQ